jgi:hypothetical protein
MKITQEKQFTPITIVIETKEELTQLLEDFDCIGKDLNLEQATCFLFEYLKKLKGE